MQQIIHIHGGETFPDESSFLVSIIEREYNPFEEIRKRKDRIQQALISTHQMIAPTMPNALNASYKAWKIWFEKIFPYLNGEEIILVGNSLGGTFLIKYLSENTFPKKIQQLHLTAAVLDNEERNKDYLGDFIIDFSKIIMVTEQVKNIYIYHSKDDPMVPYSHAERLTKLLP